MSNRFPVQQQEVLSLKPSGLWTYPNPVSSVPQGALKTAKNIIMQRPNEVEQRRGINTEGPAFTGNVNRLYNFQNQIIASYSSKLSFYSSDLSSRTDYTGTYDAPTGALTIHAAQSNKNIYFTTATGVKKLSTISGNVTFSGAPAGLDGSGVTTGSGWFSDQTQAAYRILFGYTDANNNLILGAPSQRIVVANNTGGDTNVSLTFTLPDGLDTTWIYQIYRSPMSVDLNTEPNDECALVFTGNPTSGELTAKVVTVIDSVNDTLKGEFIYTASSQQGIDQANYQPPIATDIATFNGFTFYFNTTSQQQIFLTLVSVGTPGLQVGDTVTIAGTIYTGASSENIAAAQFQVFTGGTPSQNITNTSNSLVRVINRYTGNTLVYAYYRSGYSDLPGRILLTERGIGGATFTAACSRDGAFVPNIGITTVTSSNLNSPNRVYISKFQQPEAVPLLQYIDIGSADKAGLRIIALRDYIMIFKQDGVFQIVGTDVTSFQEQLVDSTTILRGLETAVALNNKVFLFSNQTVISITFSEGALLKSESIKKDLLVLSSPLFPFFDSASFGISYESDNEYILATVTNTTDTAPTQYFVYNYITDCWSTWQFPYTMGCGFVNPTDDKLYFGSSDSGSRFLYQERKDFAETDYADNSYPVTIVGSAGFVVELTDTSSAAVGYTLSQSDRLSQIVSVNDSTHITVTKDLAWTAGDAIIYRPIEVALQFVPEACGNAGIVKHFKEVQTIFSFADFESFDLGFSTDFYSPVNKVTLVPKITTGWGNGPWGEFPWGSGAPDIQVIRGLVPLSQRRGHWLNISVNYADALTNFSLDGFAIFYSNSSQRFH